MLVDRAQLLTLSALEMTALVGGLRVLDVDTDDSSHGVLTDNVGTLSNDFFVNLLDVDTFVAAWDKVMNLDRGCLVGGDSVTSC